jgi:hypothetical protein
MLNAVARRRYAFACRNVVMTTERVATIDSID